METCKLCGPSGYCREGLQLREKGEILESIAVGVNGQVQGFRFKDETLEDAAARCILEAEMHGNNGKARIHLSLKEETEPEVGQSQIAATLAKAIFTANGVEIKAREGRSVEAVVVEQAGIMLQRGLAMIIDRELAEIRAAFENLPPCPIVTHHPEGPCSFCAGHAMRVVLEIKEAA